MKTCIVCDNHMNQFNNWVWKCPKCHFMSSNLSEGVGRGVDGIEELRRENFHILCNRLERISPLKNNSCLEIGCAEGWFLDELNSRKANYIGIEPSEVSNIAKNAGHKVLVGYFPDILKNEDKFDLIVFNDVFEHLPDPIKTIKDCENRLTEGGLLVINLPNSNGVFYKISELLSKLGISAMFKRLWQYGFSSPHLTYFNEKNLENFTRRYSKLTVVDKFHLRSIKKNGLKKRIFSSHRGVLGWVIYLSVLIAIPIISFLPSDIAVLVFQKKQISQQ